MTESLSHYEDCIRCEMLVHPVLFTHPQALDVAILGDETHALSVEISKHLNIQTIWQITPIGSKNTSQNQDSRIQTITQDMQTTLNTLAAESLDVLIIPKTITPFSKALYTSYFQALKPNGILVQNAQSAFHLANLKALNDQMQEIGFRESQIYHFPQTTSWSAAMMSVKQGFFKRAREKDIFNKPFSTRYYNYDVHKAAFVMPEWMREELLPE